MHPLWLLSARSEFAEDQLFCLLFERAPGAQLVSAAPAMNARTVGERPWELNRGRAASPARKQNAHASDDPKAPMQDCIPSERASSTQGQEDVVERHAGAPGVFCTALDRQEDTGPRARTERGRWL